MSTTIIKLKDDTELYIDRSGEGAPMVFVHGVMMSSRFFRLQKQYFQDHYDVIIPDLRGHGRSPTASSGHTVPQYARDLAEVIDQLGLRDVVLVGWSMGAFIVWDYLHQFGSHNVVGTAIVDEYPADFKWPDYEFGFADLPILSGLMELIQTDYPAVVEQLIELIFKKRPVKDDLQWIRREISSIAPNSASAIFFDQTMRDYRTTLPKLNVPSLICMGRDEKLVSVAAGEYITKLLPDAKMQVFEESCHCPFLEEPDKFNQILHEFIRSQGV